MDFSQGGFSIFFERHDYQDVAVNAYLEHLGNKHSGRFKCDRTCIANPS